MDFNKYRILGAMPLCNVVVQENDNGKVEVTAVDLMAAVENEQLREVASEIRRRLKKIIENL